MKDYEFRVHYSGKYSISSKDDLGIFLQRGETPEKAYKALLKRLYAANLGTQGCLEAVLAT